jgi:hypothetical protein
MVQAVRVPAEQVQGPEFKAQCHQRTKTETKCMI